MPRTGGVNGPLRLQTTTAQPHRHLEEGGGRRGLRTERGSSRGVSRAIFSSLLHSSDFWSSFFFQLLFFFSAWVKTGVVRVSSCHFLFSSSEFHCFLTMPGPGAGRGVGYRMAPREASFRLRLLSGLVSFPSIHAALLSLPSRLIPLTIGARAHEACLMN